MRFDWRAWWIAREVIRTANPRDCHDYVTRWAVAQFRADEAERRATKAARNTP